MHGFGDHDQPIQLADQRANRIVPRSRGLGEAAMAQTVAIARLSATPPRRRKAPHTGEQRHEMRGRFHLEPHDRLLVGR
jgi:hypothetical protein